MIRLFLADSPSLAEGASIVLLPDASRYLAAVMRKGPGDEILVFNGRDGEWLARIDAVGKKSVTLVAERQTRPQPTGAGPVLLVALIKRARLETIVEKATELGASKVQLLITHRSNSDHTNVERLTLIAREAAEQTERLDVPEILSPVKLDRLLDSLDYSAVFFGDEDSTHESDEKVTLPMLAAIEKCGFENRSASGDFGEANPSLSAILIGPEGGFDDDERQRLRELPNVHPVNLGPRILRADTAAISALTLFQAAAGDWK